MKIWPNSKCPICKEPLADIVDTREGDKLERLYSHKRRPALTTGFHRRKPCFRTFSDLSIARTERWLYEDPNYRKVS